MNPVISIIYAGGTFGSHGTPLSPLAMGKFFPAFDAHLQSQKQSHNWHIQWIDNPIIKDSSTLIPYDFVSFYELIIHHYQHGMRHFIIITGTDTLSYLASFLSIALRKIPISLVVTGSMSPFFQADTYPLVHDHTSDAHLNLQSALEFLANLAPCGVFVSFAGNILDGLSTQKIHANDSNAFSGIVIKHTNTSKATIKHTNINHNMPSLLNQARTTYIHTFYATPCHADDIAYQLSYLQHQSPTALILIGYGAGNLPTSNNLRQTLATLIDKGFLIIMSKAPPFGCALPSYQAGSWQYDMSIICGSNMPISEIYARCLWICLNHHPNHPFDKITAWQELLKP